MDVLHVLPPTFQRYENYCRWVLDPKRPIYIKVSVYLWSIPSFPFVLFFRYTGNKLPTCKIFFLFLFRATPVRAEAAVEEEEQGMKTTRSPPSHPPTMPTLLCCTSWSTRQVTPSTPCLTMACSTPTPTPSCPPSWCPTCWVRTPTSSQGLCTQWVHFFFLFLSILF